MIRSLLILFLALVIAGCQTKQKDVKEVPVYVVKTIVLTVPDNFTVPNTIPKPPSKTKYVNGDWDTKEDLLIKYSKALDRELRMCMADKASIRNNIKEKLLNYKDAEIVK